MKRLKEQKEKRKKVLNNVTLIFLFLFPLFSTVYFHSSIITLFEVITVFIIFLLTIIIFSESRKNVKYIFLYYLLCLIYLIISYLRAQNFVSLVPNNFNYSLIKEGLTILKLITPITFLYSLYYQKIEWKKYIIVLKVWTILISFTIIITNILKLSLSSYTDKLITKNIFEWSINNYYQETASKGLFMYANQQAAFMIMLLLIFVYDFLYKNKKSIFYILVLSLAMLKLGTRVSSVGGLLTLICATIFYVILILYKKEKINWHFLYILIPISIWIILLPISPYANRNIELNIAYEINDFDILAYGEIKENAEILDEKINYVYANYNPNYLPKVFFENYYPIKYDTEFWYNYVKNTKIEDINYRNIEKSIIKRVIEINDNKFDILFGISNTRIQNIVNIESDFVLHYYAFGIVGALLLLFVYIFLIVNSLYNFFKYQTYYMFTITTVILLFIFSAYLTGNIINSTNIIIPFTFIASGVFISKKVDN